MRLVGNLIDPMNPKSQPSREWSVVVYSASPEKVTYRVAYGRPSIRAAGVFVSQADLFHGYSKPLWGLFWWPFRRTVERAAAQAKVESWRRNERDAASALMRTLGESKL